MPNPNEVNSKLRAKPKLASVWDREVSRRVIEVVGFLVRVTKRGKIQGRPSVAVQVSIVLAVVKVCEIESHLGCCEVENDVRACHCVVVSW